MKRNSPSLHLLAAMVASLTFASCGSGASVSTDFAPVAPASMFIERPIRFCGQEASDVLSIGYYGPAPLDTEIVVNVVCHQKDTVFRESYPSQWFLEGSSATTDSAKTDAIQEKMRELAEGKLQPLVVDSIKAASEGQAVIGWELAGHVRRILFFSRTDHKVHQYD